MSFSPAALRRVMRELAELKNNPPEGIRIQTSEEDMFDVTGIIEGPEGTPYAGGYFKVKFKFTEDFPNSPPKCWMATKIFHPNVSKSGEICVNTLKKDWKPEYGVGHILTTVKCLLIYPNPESALDEEAGKLLLENYHSYCERAKLITSVHAKMRAKPAEFETPTQSQASPLASTPSTSSSAISAILERTPISSVAQPNSLTVPHTVRKSTSPTSIPQPLKTSPSNLSSEKEIQMKGDRQPSPLSTADSNVASKTAAMVGLSASGWCNPRA